MSGLCRHPEAAAIRVATADDAKTIFDFIVALALYEREPNAVETTAEILAMQLASKSPPFECLIAELQDEPVGFALFFANYSTWKGCTGIYLEDLFVPEEHRGKGVGKTLLSELARLTINRGGARLEWSVLDWNQDSIDFYEKLGADIRRDWLPCRLSDNALHDLATKA